MNFEWGVNPIPKIPWGQASEAQYALKQFLILHKVAVAVGKLSCWFCLFPPACWKKSLGVFVLLRFGWAGRWCGVGIFILSGHFGVRWVDIYHGKPTVAPHGTKRQRPQSQVKDVADMAILSARMEASKSSKRRRKTATNHPLGCFLPKLISTRNQKQKWWDMIASGFATCDGKLISSSITWSIFSSICFHRIKISTTFDSASRICQIARILRPSAVWKKHWSDWRWASIWWPPVLAA